MARIILNITLCVIVCTSTLTSCDIIEEPYFEDSYLVDDQTDFPAIQDSSKNILIEEFTGQKCTYCPAGQVIIEELLEEYPGRVAVVAFHAGPFADTNKLYPSFYKTEMGETLYQSYNSPSMPGALINRGNVSSGRSYWKGMADSAITEQSVAVIQLKAEYNTETKKVKIFTLSTLLTDTLPDLNLGIYITEDSLRSPQLDNGVIVEDYVHNHVFRMGVTAYQGIPMQFSGSLHEKLAKTFLVPLSENWRTENLSIVAFLLNTHTNNIVQVNTIKIIEE
jgi:thiol-disulfide isomerase/thioredoxin